MTDSYLCPICFRKYKYQEIVELSVEHIIPRKLGGSKVILTCKECNNKFGSKYISKFIKGLEINDIVLGFSDEPLEAQLNISGMKLQSEYYVNEEVETFKIQAHRTNPQNIEDAISLAKKQKLDEIKVDIKLGSSSQYSRITLLLTAHLFLFSHFGYYYLFNDSGLFIRNVIEKEWDEHYICNNFDLSNKKDIKILLNQGNYLLICDRPKDIQNYALVLMPFKTKYSTYIYGMLLPFLPGIIIKKKNYLVGKSLTFSGVGFKFNKDPIEKPFLRLPGGRYIFS